MATGGPDELTLEEIFRHMEEVAQSADPNLERIGCPLDETLKSLARDPRSFPIFDPIFDPVGKCTSCAQLIQEIGSRR